MRVRAAATSDVSCQICSSFVSPTFSCFNKVPCKPVHQTVHVDTSITFMLPASGVRSTTQTNRHSSSHQGFMLVVPSHAGLSSQQYLSGRKIW